MKATYSAGGGENNLTCAWGLWSTCLSCFWSFWL